MSKELEQKGKLKGEIEDSLNLHPHRIDPDNINCTPVKELMSREGEPASCTRQESLVESNRR
jgi:hypothetical protein